VAPVTARRLVDTAGFFLGNCALHRGIVGLETRSVNRRNFCSRDPDASTIELAAKCHSGCRSVPNFCEAAWRCMQWLSCRMPIVAAMAEALLSSPSHSQSLPPSGPTITMLFFTSSHEHHVAFGVGNWPWITDLDLTRCAFPPDMRPRSGMNGFGHSRHANSWAVPRPPALVFLPPTLGAQGRRPAGGNDPPYHTKAWTSSWPMSRVYRGSPPHANSRRRGTAIPQYYEREKTQTCAAGRAFLDFRRHSVVGRPCFLVKNST